MTWKLAIRHIVSRPFLSTFTLVGITITLTILGVFWTLVENMDRVKVQQESLSSSEAVPGLTVFAESKLSAGDVSQLKSQLMKSGNFKDVVLVESKEALRDLERQFGEVLSKAFEGDSLPTTLKLQFADKKMSRSEWLRLLNEIRALPKVLEVDEGQGLMPVAQVNTTNRVISWATGLLVMVFSIVALLVSHLIRIAFENLKSEIETLKVMGASKFWIFKPLLLEGLFFGILGAGLSVGFLTLAVKSIDPKYVSRFFADGFQISLLSPSSTLTLFGLGLGASVIGALFTWPLIERPATEI